MPDAHDPARTRNRGRHGLTAVLLVLALALVWAPTNSQAVGTSSRLSAGTRLTAGQSLTSPDGLNVLTMQADGNLVEYSDGSAIWCSDTNGIADGGYLWMSTNGNATVYTTSGTAAWTTGTTGTGSANYLAVQDDGNVVVYTSSATAVFSAKARATTLFPGHRLSSGRSLYSVNEAYRATMQSDGNFVLYHGSSLLWSSGTGGAAVGGYVTMQTDGNLVIYSASGHGVWTSGTSGSGGANSLVLQDDANLVMYRSLSNSAAWSTHTYDGVQMTPQLYARQYMLANYHWGMDKFTDLDLLWTRESGWRWDAKNPSSGAYGIPQALPASKMAANGSDYLTSFKTQIRWGTGYIKAVYGSPIQAWAHSQKYGWYSVP